MYLSFFSHIALIASLVVVPGLFWNCLCPSRKLDITVLPIPGVLVLGVFGVFFWKSNPDYTFLPKIMLIGLYAAAVVFTFLRVFAEFVDQRAFTERFRTSVGTPKALVLTIYVLVLLQAAATGINPEKVAQEFGVGGSFPGRMIASPPDHLGPYNAATYYYDQLDGLEQTGRFGEWGLTARGPLVPLGINTLLHTFDAIDPNPKKHRKSKRQRKAEWPLSERGEHLARAYGWLLNSLVILGAYALLSALGASRFALVTALVWLALSPVVVINTVFTWPKLLATYFVLLAIAAIVRRRTGLAGGLMALAWLSHPVGALLIPSVGLFALLVAPIRKPGTRLLERMRFVAPAAILGTLAMSPWLAFKLYLGQPDPFATYITGGGRGFEPASSFEEWLQVRWNNVWYTLVPFVFYFDGYMKSWIYGPLNDALRWFIQYAKSLPGHLGFSCFVPAYASVIHPSEDKICSAYRLALLVSSFAVTVIFWGYSADGLGRNALEPLSVLLIIFAVAFFPFTRSWLYFALPLLAIEGQALQIGGFVFDEGFALERVGFAAWLCWIASIAVSVALLCIFYIERAGHSAQYTEA